jgi:aminotransferase in exopolysaccharide biosynthesis
MYESALKFIQDIYKTKKFIPLHEPRFIGNEKSFLLKTIDSTFVSSVGEFVDRFESDLSSFTGSEKAIALVNGTSALHLSLVLSDVQPDDYVITQSLTFVATCNAISYCKAEPIFIDVDKNTLGMSPLSLETWLENSAFIDSRNVCRLKKNKRPIKACVPMHTFGHPVEIDKIKLICEKWQLKLIEDAAESLGSHYKGKHTGTFGQLGAISFNGNKIITTGGGGALLCNKKLYKTGKYLSTTAKKPDNINFFHDKIGFNYRLPNLNAALGCAQLEYIEKFLLQKRHLANAYKKYFKNSEFSFFSEPENCRSNYWLNTLICNDKNQRDSFLSYMNSNGVMSRPVWTPMHKLPMFSEAICDNLLNTSWLEERIVNIPSSVVI